MFRCSYTAFRQFTIMLARVMNCYNDTIQYNIVVCCYDKMLVNVAAYVILVCVCVCVCVCVGGGGLE
jgi:hypothetical protein